MSASNNGKKPCKCKICDKTFEISVAIVLEKYTRNR